MRWIVLLAAFAGCGGSSECTMVSLALDGELHHDAIGGFATTQGFDFTTGMVAEQTGEIAVASNLDVSAGSNSYVGAVGPVAAVADVKFPTANNWAKTVAPQTGDGFAVRSKDGCPIAVRVLSHESSGSTGSSGDPTMTFEWERVDCVPVAIKFTPQPAPVTCPPNAPMHTPGPSAAVEIAGFPPIETNFGGTYSTAVTLSLNVPRGARITPTIVNPDNIPITTTWAGSCTSEDCSVCADDQPSVEVTVAWTPRCVPGA